MATCMPATAFSVAALPGLRRRLLEPRRLGELAQSCFGPTAEAAGLEKTRPYDLRHSFCSLLIHEGATVVEVARQLGHAPTMTLNTYGHVFDELQGAERLSAEEQIPKGTRQACVRLRALDSYLTSRVNKTPANR
jgi:integrase